MAKESLELVRADNNVHVQDRVVPVVLIAVGVGYDEKVGTAR
jgi:hypothetical protein